MPSTTTGAEDTDINKICSLPWQSWKTHPKICVVQSAKCSIGGAHWALWEHWTSRGRRGKGCSNSRAGLTGGDRQATTRQWHLNSGPATNQNPTTAWPHDDLPGGQISQSATNYATNYCGTWQTLFTRTPQVGRHNKEAYALRVEI